MHDSDAEPDRAPNLATSDGHGLPPIPLPEVDALHARLRGEYQPREGGVERCSCPEALCYAAVLRRIAGAHPGDAALWAPLAIRDAARALADIGSPE
jgi:hypothetical protein